MKKHNNGFTLAELLIVVAIIAVLVAISIPIFSSQLEKSREATDLANVRSAYAELIAAVTTDDDSACYVDSNGQSVKMKQANGSFQIVVSPLKQKVDDWSTKLPITIAGVTYQGNGFNPNWVGIPVANGKCTITYSETGGVVFNWEGLSFTPGACWYADAAAKTLTFKSEGYGNMWVSNALNEQFDAKVGQKVNFDSLTSQKLLKEEIDKGYSYEIGLFYLDPNQTDSNGNAKFFWDTGRVTLPNNGGFYTVRGDGYADGYQAKVAVQVFKKAPDGTYVQMSAEESAQLAKLISVK